MADDLGDLHAGHLVVEELSVLVARKGQNPDQEGHLEE